MVKSSSSTGSFCHLEGSREEACPVKRGELLFATAVLYNNPFTVLLKCWFCFFVLFTHNVSETAAKMAANVSVRYEEAMCVMVSRCVCGQEWSRPRPIVRRFCSLGLITWTLFTAKNKTSSHTDAVPSHHRLRSWQSNPDVWHLMLENLLLKGQF